VRAERHASSPQYHHNKCKTFFSFVPPRENGISLSSSKDTVAKGPFDRIWAVQYRAAYTSVQRSWSEMCLPLYAVIACRGRSRNRNESPALIVHRPLPFYRPLSCSLGLDDDLHQAGIFNTSILQAATVENGQRGKCRDPLIRSGNIIIAKLKS
jgi:hypothetical protein